MPNCVSIIKGLAYGMLSISNGESNIVMVLNRIYREKPTRKLTPLGLQYTVSVRPVAPGVMMGKPYGLDRNFVCVD
jgi:hypothetical protein